MVLAYAAEDHLRSIEILLNDTALTHGHGPLSRIAGWFSGKTETTRRGHAVESRKGRRKLFDIEILYDLPIEIGMAVIGDGHARWLGLQQTATLAFVAARSYLGPRGFEVMLTKWYGKKIVGE